MAVVNSGENYDQDAEPVLLADGQPERQAVDAGAGLPGFVIGLEEALQRTGLELRQKLFEADKHQRPVDDVDALSRETMGMQQTLVASAGRQLLADSILAVAQSVGGLLSSAATTCGLREVPLPGRPWQDVADALFQAGRSTTQAIHDALRSLLPAEGSQSALDLRLQMEERDDDPGSKSQICNLQSAILESEQTEAFAVPLVAALFASGVWQALAPACQSDRQTTIVRRRAL